MNRLLACSLLLLVLTTGCATFLGDEEISVETSYSFFITAADSLTNTQIGRQIAIEPEPHLVLPPNLIDEIIRQPDWIYPDKLALLEADVSATPRTLEVTFSGASKRITYEVQGIQLEIKATFRVEEALDPAVYDFYLSLPVLQAVLQENNAVIRTPNGREIEAPDRIKFHTIINVTSSQRTATNKVLIYGVIAFFGLLGGWALFEYVRMQSRYSARRFKR
jgi:hypothetical protein